MSHDVNAEVDDLEPDVPHVWHIWRRSDGFVGITPVDPHIVFTEDFKYVVLHVTSDVGRAYHGASMARSAN